MPRHARLTDRQWDRHRRWAADGTWDRVPGVLLAHADGGGLIDWQVAVDSTITRAHQHPPPREVPGRRPRAGP